MSQRHLKGLMMMLVFGAVTAAVAEEITLVTYYPSPRGVYEELRTTNNTYLATQGGNVGIGTAAPGRTVHILAADPIFRIENSGGNGYVSIETKNTTQNWISGINPGGVGVATNDFMIVDDTTGGGNNIRFRLEPGASGGTSPFVINASGNLGIGTTSPATKLHVLGPGGDVIRASGPNWSAGIGPGGSSSFAGAGFYYNGTMVLEVASNSGTALGSYASGLRDPPSDGLIVAGNVGIGTSAPQSALHVPDGKYAQFEDNNAGPPPAADCDADAERGRLSIDTAANRLYVCNGAVRGWDHVTLMN